MAKGDIRCARVACGRQRAVAAYRPAGAMMRHLRRSALRQVDSAISGLSARQGSAGRFAGSVGFEVQHAPYVLELVVELVSQLLVPICSTGWKASPPWRKRVAVAAVSLQDAFQPFVAASADFDLYLLDPAMHTCSQWSPAEVCRNSGWHRSSSNCPDQACSRHRIRCHCD